MQCPARQRSAGEAFCDGWEEGVACNKPSQVLQKPILPLGLRLALGFCSFKVWCLGRASCTLKCAVALLLRIVALCEGQRGSCTIGLGFLGWAFYFHWVLHGWVLHRWIYRELVLHVCACSLAILNKHHGACRVSPWVHGMGWLMHDTMHTES